MFALCGQTGKRQDETIEMDQTAAALCVRKKRWGKQQQRTTNAIIFLTFPCKVNEVYTQEYKFDGGKNKNNKQHKLL